MQRSTDEVSFLLARAALLATEPLSVEVLDAMGLDAVRQAVRSDGALGMGVVTSSVSVASQMGTEAAKSLAGVVAATVAGGVVALFRSKLSGVLRRKRKIPAKTVVLPVTAAQASRAAEVAAQRGRALGLSEAKARLLADAIAGALLTGELAAS